MYKIQNNGNMNQTVHSPRYHTQYNETQTLNSDDSYD